MLKQYTGTLLSKQLVDELCAIGIERVEALILVDDDHLLRNVSLDSVKLARIRSKLLEMHARPPISARDLLCYEMDNNAATISNGYANLDVITNGGIVAGRIMELYGASGTGKTQICFRSALQCAHLGWNVLFIDTVASFSLQRLRAMLVDENKSTESINACLQRIQVRRLCAAHELIDLLAELDERRRSPLIMDNSAQKRLLIIIDSLGVTFSALSSGVERSTLFSRSLEQVSREMKWLASSVTHPTAIMYTNKCLTTRTTAALGETNQYIAHVRLRLERANDEVDADTGRLFVRAHVERHCGRAISATNNVSRPFSV